MHRAYKYRLKISPSAERHMVVTAGHARFVWNRYLAESKQLLDAGERIPSYAAWSDDLTQLKDEYPFLKEADAQALQQKLRDLRAALGECFKKKKVFPRFKKKYQHDAYRLPQGVRVDNRHVKLGKAGWVRFYRSRKIPMDAVIKSATVQREADGWYVSLLLAFSEPQEMKPVRHASPQSMVGGDLGVRDFLAPSNGQTTPGLQYARAAHGRLVSLQRGLARKEKGSSNYRKQVRKIARAHKRVADARRDALRKLADDVCKNHALVALEDLRINNMTKSAKGSVEHPGRNVRQKAGLNRAILDQGWGIFRGFVEEHAQKQGSTFILVEPRFSSQECSECGHIASGNRIAKRFCCEACGSEKDADVNAARNILNRAVLKLNEDRLVAA